MMLNQSRSLVFRHPYLFAGVLLVAILAALFGVSKLPNSGNSKSIPNPEDLAHRSAVRADRVAAKPTAVTPVATTTLTAPPSPGATPPQPTQPAGQIASAATTGGVAVNCATTSVPYQTIYKNVTSLAAGQTATAAGTPGLLKTCTYSDGRQPTSQLLAPPVDKVIMRGIAPATEGSQPTTPVSLPSLPLKVF